MILIVGLGNPGEKYTHNRHNVGFMFADYFLNYITTSYQLPTTGYKHDKYSKSEITKIDLQATDYKLQALIAKPQTYMNRSGETVRQLMASNKIPIDNIFVAHDDLDIQLGNFKIQQGVGPKKHNGLSSIEELIHNQNFWRIRIGVDSRNGDRTLSGEDYVLQNFIREEQTILQNTFSTIIQRFLTVISS